MNTTKILVTPEVFTSAFGEGERDIVAVELTHDVSGHPVLIFTVEGDVPDSEFCKVVVHRTSDAQHTFTLEPAQK